METIATLLIIWVVVAVGNTLVLFAGKRVDLTGSVVETYNRLFWISWLWPLVVIDLLTGLNMARRVVRWAGRWTGGETKQP